MKEDKEGNLEFRSNELIEKDATFSSKINKIEIDNIKYLKTLTKKVESHDGYDIKYNFIIRTLGLKVPELLWVDNCDLNTEIKEEIMQAFVDSYL